MVYQPHRTWTGLGANNNWSTAANWDNGAPDNSDNLIFPVGLLRLANTNDFNNLRVNQIVFDGAGYTLNGNQLSMANPGAGGGWFQNVAGNNTVNLAWVNSASTAVDVNVAAGGDIIFNGVISRRPPKLRRQPSPHSHDGATYDLNEEIDNVACFPPDDDTGLTNGTQYFSTSTLPDFRRCRCAQ
jgi:hypothetical protein